MMEDWALRAMSRWPNVPALFGWLSLNRRGDWLIRGEVISRTQIIDTINANYAPDQYGRWFFQNGPQRGYVALAYSPLILNSTANGSVLVTHTGLAVQRPSGSFLDNEGNLVVMTEHGPGLIADTDLDWAIDRLTHEGNSINEKHLATAMLLPSNETTMMRLTIGDIELPVVRLESSAMPSRLGFARNPQPRQGERFAAGTTPE